MADWILTSVAMPSAGDLIVKKWKNGSVWAGRYYPPTTLSGKADSSFESWFKLPEDSLQESVD